MLLIDTGIFVAAADRTEPHHNACATLLRNEADLAVTAATIPEAAWLIESRLGPSAEARFLNLVTSSRFTIIDLTDNDNQRAIALITSYTDLGLGFVDASIIAIAERLGETTIATLNQRDFAVVRPTHCDAFGLGPAWARHRCGQRAQPGRRQARPGRRDPTSWPPRSTG